MSAVSALLAPRALYLQLERSFYLSILFSISLHRRVVSWDSAVDIADAG